MNGTQILAYLVIPALSLAIAFLAYRRGRRTASLTDSLSTVQLWREANLALENRVAGLEEQNRHLIEQNRQQASEMSLLRELVTSAAKVDALSVKVELNHAELMRVLSGRTQ